MAGVHKVLCSAGDIAVKGGHDFYLGADGGHIIPLHSEIGKKMRDYFDYLLKWYGADDLLPVYLEGNVYKFYMQREVDSRDESAVEEEERQTSAERTSSSGNGSGRADSP